MSKFHTKTDFKVFMSQLLETNATLDFFCDFDKIRSNVESISIELNTLNYLIGKQDLMHAVRCLWNRDKTIFQHLDILIALRAENNKMYLKKDFSVSPVKSLFNSPEGVVLFLEETGLAELLRNREIKNLVDYVFGVETGLDSNARKNRSGHMMEKWVGDFFTKHHIPYSQEVRSTELPLVNAILGNDIKRFDFVVKSSQTTYLIEVNFYSGGGSKPSEVARAYTELSPKINDINGYKFVWITDGIGWKGVGAFHEAYEEIPYIFNLANLELFVKLVNGELQ